MRKNFWLGLVLLLVIPGFLFTTSCAKKTVKKEPMAKAAEDEAAKKAAAAEAARQAELERQKQQLEDQRIKEEKIRADAERLKMEGERVRFENELIHFDFDKSNIKPEAEVILKRKAEFLNKFPATKVVIEGHCDERGTEEYNLALGDRRASSAKKFLVNLGIDGARLKTISYGEEKPLDPGHNEAAWAKNRRCQFVIE